jgi:hypothetical protein
MKITKRIGKIIGAGIIIVLLSSTFTGMSMIPSSDTTAFTYRNTSPPETLDEYTHTVFVEACTTSWCPPCAIAARVMNDIFYSGMYDFYYVALVADKNGYASQRCQELGVSSIPDYVFDGGYTRHVGSGGIPYAYTSRLDQCGARDVSDIDLELDITWNGDAQIDINLDIINNEGSEYNAHLHVYVTEIISRWNTNLGEPYHFAMVGNYAFNENVNIPAGETSEHSTSWDGSQYGVADLAEDNVMVIATVFDTNKNNYIDETAAASFIELWPPDLELDISGKLGGIRANLKNNGTEDMEEISWEIQVTGGILRLIDVSTEGTIDILEAGDELILQSDKFVFGLGTASVSININIWRRTARALVIGPFILVLG